ncbi:(d)CMP kinase [Fulvivirgaceae bacterium BMA10]|uniref:Cytidylate kinase n=1 Tax=Splendidivirga corallicola TaxID=3051826 RepID=A0ABT8KU40_9BACT|nr:(d)CMP kinase [Fulvivirgaceae bacterium BMA10]
MKKIVIAIDGYSACGKSTAAKAVADELGYIYIDSGAMYRAVTLYFIENYVNLTNPKAVDKALDDIQITFIRNPKTGAVETYLNGLNVEYDIRSMEVSLKVSEVSALTQVRKVMVEQQRRMGKKRGVVMDGRDIGTNVFPDAELKVFMTADFHVRAERRQKELLERDNLVNLDEIKANLRHRDKLDTTREENPLRKAEDAYEIDTTHLTIEEEIEEIINLATSKMIGEKVNEESN